MPPSILLYGLLYTSLSCVSFDEGVFCKYLLGQNVFIMYSNNTSEKYKPKHMFKILYEK